MEGRRLRAFLSLNSGQRERSSVCQQDGHHVGEVQHLGGRTIWCAQSQDEGRRSGGPGRKPRVPACLRSRVQALVRVMMRVVSQTTLVLVHIRSMSHRAGPHCGLGQIEAADHLTDRAVVSAVQLDDLSLERRVERPIRSLGPGFWSSMLNILSGVMPQIVDVGNSGGCPGR